MAIKYVTKDGVQESRTIATPENMKVIAADANNNYIWALSERHLYKVDVSDTVPVISSGLLFNLWDGINENIDRKFMAAFIDKDRNIWACEGRTVYKYSLLNFDVDVLTPTIRPSTTKTVTVGSNYGGIKAFTILKNGNACVGTYVDNITPVPASIKIISTDLSGNLFIHSSYNTAVNGICQSDDELIWVTSASYIRKYNQNGLTEVGSYSKGGEYWAIGFYDGYIYAYRKDNGYLYKYRPSDCSQEGFIAGNGSNNFTNSDFTGYIKKEITGGCYAIDDASISWVINLEDFMADYGQPANSFDIPEDVVFGDNELLVKSINGGLTTIDGTSNIQVVFNKDIIASSFNSDNVKLYRQLSYYPQLNAETDLIFYLLFEGTNISAGRRIEAVGGSWTSADMTHFQQGRFNGLKNSIRPTTTVTQNYTWHAPEYVGFYDYFTLSSWLKISDFNKSSKPIRQIDNASQLSIIDHFNRELEYSTVQVTSIFEIGHTQGGVYVFALSIINNDTVYIGHKDNFGIFNLNCKIPSNEWINISVIKNNVEKKYYVYVNFELVLEYNYLTNLTGAGYPAFYLGKGEGYVPGNTGILGRLTYDSIIMYHRILTINQIKQISGIEEISCTYSNTDNKTFEINPSVNLYDNELLNIVISDRVNSLVDDTDLLNKMFSKQLSVSNTVSNPEPYISTKDCIYFDGINDKTCACIGCYSSVHNLTKITIEAQLSRDSWTTVPKIIYIADKYNTNYGYRLSINTDGRLEGLVGVASTYRQLYTTADKTQTLSAGIHHFAMTYSGTDLILYIDGVVVASQNYANLPLDSSATRLIGINNDIRLFAISNRMEFKIADLRIWNINRTQNEIQTNMYSDLIGTESGLVGLWKMNDGRGMLLSDLTSNKGHGTVLMNNSTDFWSNLTHKVIMKKVLTNIEMTATGAGQSIFYTYSPDSEPADPTDLSTPYLGPIPYVEGSYKTICKKGSLYGMINYEFFYDATLPLVNYPLQSNANDVSGHNFHGTVPVSGTFDGDSFTAINASSFSRVPQIVTDSLMASGFVSLSVWIKEGAVAISGCPFDFRNGNQSDGYHFPYPATSGYYSSTFRTTRTENVAIGIPANRKVWNHYVITNEWKLYINGVLIHTATKEALNIDNNHSIIGANLTAYKNASIKKFLIYTKNLTQEEVTTIYNLG